jgi:CBS domain-containing membrane protein
MSTAIQHYFKDWNSPATAIGQKEHEGAIQHYFSKFLGTDIPMIGIPHPTYRIVISAFVSSFLGMLAVGSLHYLGPVPLQEHAMIGSFGAVAVLIYSAIDSPLAQPRQVIFGNLISAFVGVSVRLVLGSACLQDEECIYRWSPLAVAFAVSLAIVAMQLTFTTHPPGGATSLIFVVSGPSITNLGYYYLLAPVLLGTVIMLLIALIFNNILRRYPLFWLRPHVLVPDLPGSMKVIQDAIEVEQGQPLDGMHDYERDMMQLDTLEHSHPSLSPPPSMPCEKCGCTCQK